jgi:Ca2+:H+ antiporter
MRRLAVLALGLPVAIAGALLHAPAWVIFVGSVVALGPFSDWIGEAADQLSDRMGPSAGGLLTATFANAAELILTVPAPRRGLSQLSAIS